MNPFFRKKRKKFKKRKKRKKNVANFSFKEKNVKKKKQKKETKKEQKKKQKKNKRKEKKRMSEYIIECPHCKEMVIIEKLNCGIFRHGIFKQSGKQMDPHAPKEICDQYIKNKQIYGCGKPFRIVVLEESGTATVQVETCEYI